MDVAKLFDKCMNCYSHEGEFKVGDNTITIFRRCSYEDFDHEDEDGNPKWIEGDEAVGAFVNQEEFFGWFYQDYNDLYECMKEVLEYLLTKKGLTVTLSVKTYVDCYGEDENTATRKKKLIDSVIRAFDLEDSNNIKDIKIKFGKMEDRVSCKIVNFNDYYSLLEILKNDVSGAIVKIDDSDPNKEALENMFKYKYDLL